MALEKLIKITQGGQRVSSESSGPGSLTSYCSDDLDAAKALAKLAIDALKLGFGPPKVKVEMKGGKGSTFQADLWDLTGPWKLKTPGV